YRSGSRHPGSTRQAVLRAMTATRWVGHLRTRSLRRRRQARRERAADRSAGSRLQSAPVDVASGMLIADPFTRRNEQLPARNHGLDATANRHSLEWAVIRGHMQAIDTTTP